MGLIEQNREPIVRTPEDAYRCFPATNIDLSVPENFVPCKNHQQPLDEAEAEAYSAQFQLD